VAVAIEVPHGPVVETLLERGAGVFAINPKQLDRFRDRFTVAGAKDDSRDALVGCEALRTDRKAFRQVHADDPAIIELRELTRIDGDLLTDLERASSRLWQQLQRYVPHWLELCPAADEPWFWAVLRLMPTPQAAGQAGVAQLAALLKTCRLRRMTAEQVFSVLRQAPLAVSAGTIAAATGHIALLVEQLELLHRQRRAVQSQIKTRLQAFLKEEEAAGEGKHRDVEILLSLPGVGWLVGGTMLAEAAGCLSRRDYHALRGLSATAPVTRQSGKSRRVIMRRACNPYLRNAVYHWSRVAVQRDARCKDHYARLRRKGHWMAAGRIGATRTGAAPPTPFDPLRIPSGGPAQDSSGRRSQKIALFSVPSC
jgi:transposase